MRSSIGAALLLCSTAVPQEELSLMQGLVRRGQISTDSKPTRKDATAKLMETATNMLKNGATPDVITFIETTITEVNQNVLGTIVHEHHRDQQLINDLLARFDAAVTAMEQCVASIDQQRIDTEASSTHHKLCRSAEALDCARSRKCEDELEELWTIVKTREFEMREIHTHIHGEWCIPPAPPHPGLEDPFHWQIAEHSEGEETSQSVHDYPVIDYTPAVLEFRRFSVEYFGHYIHKLPEVELAWENYNRKLVECAAKEETWTLKVEECDGFQDTLRDQACAHAGNSRQCLSNFGHEYHMTMVAYTTAVETIRQLEYDRKREWETLHIVTCLLETVYTHVIHSIDSGEPCPTTESHPEQTAAEINYCHVVEESMTANLTIDYGTPPTPPEPPPPQPFPCNAAYISEETTFTAEIISSHAETIALEGLEDYYTVVSAYGWAGCAAPKACVPCEFDELIVDPNYVENDVCKHHHEHLHPGQMDMDSFKCLGGDQCIRSSGRCNGVANCDDGSDESGCNTDWGVPALLGHEECQVPFLSDVQFQCGDGTCTHVAGRCNGINNCDNGSDEEGCPTTTQGVTVEAMTGFTATIITPGIETSVFTDRTYIFDSLGSFTGHSYVQMSNEDKHIRNSHVQMKLRFTQPTVVYIVKLDDQVLPWLASEGWSLSSLTGVSYSGIRETRHTDWSGVVNEDHYGPGEVYEKIFPAGAVELRGNNGGDGSYLVFVANPAHRPAPPVVELWPPVLGSENGERVKCNNNIDMVYVADQAECQQLALANGHPFYSFRHNAESSGHKCMSSAHCDDHLTGRTNEWHIYSAAPPAPAPAPTLPEAPTCPVGWVQVGQPGADIGGCGLQSCGERYDVPTVEACAARCDSLEECDGFNFAPMFGDRNHEDTTVCTLYNSNMPTGEWSGSAGFVQVFCARETAGSTSECAADVLEKCQGNTPCIDLREAAIHHHLMWLNEDGTAHVDGEAGGINAGDHRTWTCTRTGDGVGLVGTWNCPGFYTTVIRISADFADDFTDARDNDFIHVCALPEPEHTGYGMPCTAATATIDGVPVCTVASNDDNPNPWVLFGDINHQISNFVASQVTSSPTRSGLHNGDSVQVGTFSTGAIGSPGYSLDIGQFCSGASCNANFDLMIQYGGSDVFSHSENGYSTTSGGFINNGHTAQGVVIGEHGLWGSNTDRPNGYYATFCAYNGGCRGHGNDFWAFSTHGVYPNAADSVVCGMYYGGSGTPWKNCPSGDNIHRMRYYIRSTDLEVEFPSMD